MDKYLLANISFSKFCRAYMDLKKDLPIRPSEMGVLNIITKRDGLYTPIMIADLLEVSKPMVANHISVLEKKGYIVKEYLKNDKRSYYVIATNKAKQLVADVESHLNKILSKVEEKLGSSEFQKLVSILETTRSVLEE